MNKFSHTIWVTLTLTLIFSSGCFNVENKISLQMKFEEGRELVYQQVSERSIQLGDNDTDVQESRSKGEMIHRVKELLPDGAARIEEISSWSWAELDSGNAVNVVSSTESLSYKMSTNGTISELEILSNEDGKKWKEYAQSNLQQSQPTFPSHPVPYTYSWTQTVKIFAESGEKLDAVTTYEIKELIEVDGHNCVVIEYNGNLILPFNVVEPDSLIRKGIDKIDVTGTIMFDYENGYVLNQHEKTKITAERARITTNQAEKYTAYIEGDLYFKLIENEEE